MIIDLPTEPGDDPAFLLAVSAIVAAVAHDELPTEVRVIRVDNWFDHKWLGFSGKGRVYFDTTWPRNHPCVALDGFRQSQTTFPPFTPARVRESRYRRLAPDVGIRETHGKRVHPGWGHSARNLHRRVATEIPGGAFVWFSSNSARNQRGALMTYVAHGVAVSQWYASFLGGPPWRLGRVKGINRDHLDALLANPTPSPRELVDRLAAHRPTPGTAASVLSRTRHSQPQIPP